MPRRGLWITLQVRCHTKVMRIYLPAHLGYIDELDLAPSQAVAPRIPIPAGTVVFAVPDELRRRAETGHRDAVEELEFTALYGAADYAIALLADQQVPHQRLVISVDLPQSAKVVPVGSEMKDRLGELVDYALTVEETITDIPIVCVHIDEPAAASVIDAALSGDNQASQDIGDLDLLWYDASELAELPRS